MNVLTRGSMKRIAAVLCALLALAFCAGAAMPGPAFGAVDKKAALDYLNAAADDFAVIDALLADKELGLLDDTTASSDEDLTAESIDKYIGLLQGYGANVGAVVQEIKTRATPDEPNIAYFKDAELLEFETASDIIGEYIQVLRYAASLMKVGDEIGQIGSVDTSNLEVAYQTVSEAISGVIKELQADDVPSYLKSMNDGLIALLTELNDTVLYSVQAAALLDPVRSSAAQYRMGILTRMVAAVSANSAKDLADRQKKIQGDLKAIEAENDGLRSWVQQNVSRLSGN